MTIGGTRDGSGARVRSHVIQDSGAYPIGRVDPADLRRRTSHRVRTTSPTSTSRPCRSRPTRCRSGAYRGAGRPEAAHIIERMMDAFAAELGMDPAEVRRRNFVSPEAFPYTNVSGTTMDSGNYAGALDTVMGQIDYAELRAEQARRRDRPRREAARAGLVGLHRDHQPGELSRLRLHRGPSRRHCAVLTGVSPHGQGHYTVFAQIAERRDRAPIRRHRSPPRRHRSRPPAATARVVPAPCRSVAPAVMQASEQLARAGQGHRREPARSQPRRHRARSRRLARSLSSGPPTVSMLWAEVAASAIETPIRAVPRRGRLPTRWLGVSVRRPTLDRRSRSGDRRGDPICAPGAATTAADGEPAARRRPGPWRCRSGSPRR